MGLLPCCCVNGNNKAEVPFLLNIRWCSRLYYKTGVQPIKQFYMLTFILMVVAGIVLFVVLGVLGWLGTAIDAVFSLLTEGVGNCFGCVIELVLMLVVLGLIVSAISLIL